MYQRFLTLFILFSSLIACFSNTANADDFIKKYDRLCQGGIRFL